MYCSVCRRNTKKKGLRYTAQRYIISSIFGINNGNELDEFIGRMIPIEDICNVSHIDKRLVNEKDFQQHGLLENSVALSVFGDFGEKRVTVLAEEIACL